MPEWRWPVNLIAKVTIKAGKEFRWDLFKCHVQ